MLVIRRYPGEKIICSHPALENDIALTVCAVEGGRIKLGIQAPSSVLVLRQELITRTIGSATQSLPEHKATEQSEQLVVIEGDTQQNRMGDRLDLRIDEEEDLFEVTWWDCFGYCLVDLRVGTAQEARALFHALLAVEEIEAD